MAQKIRIGIDVGGTFTHAVAIDYYTSKVISHSVTPTTHTSENSISDGIVQVFGDIISKTGVDKSDVAFVAHSTTQATNALLEGDVAKVGIIGMGKGAEKIKAINDTNIKKLELSRGKILETEHHYLETNDRNFTDETITKILKSMKDSGCQVIVASEAFGVDDPTSEDKVVSLAAQNGILSTAGYEISQLYGLKVRTRTAVINASILPKMTDTANLTELSIKKSGIEAPLMIMRSDGGVMDLEQMRKRPILTMLSGPAAGIAAALMFTKVSDGIFLEIGGTSTDISAIKNGKAMIKSASVGGHTTYLRTLDSRTVGIGGGSMSRVKDGNIVEVGPRSAHIAGLGYIAFSNPDELADVKPILFSPMASDPGDYLGLENGKGKKFAVTLTDASILLGMSKEGDYAYNNYDVVKRVFDILGEFFNKSGLKIAEEILDGAIHKVKPIVVGLLNEYEIDPELVSLVGGGGGASTVVPWLSKKINMTYVIAEKAEVISAVGAALAMLRDSVERTVVNPSENDIISIKKEAYNRLASMGADANTIDVQIEIEKSKNILRAIATGSFEMDQDYHTSQKLAEEEIRKNAAVSFKSAIDTVKLITNTDGLYVYEKTETKKRFFGLFKSEKRGYRLLDSFGVVKLQTNDGRCYVRKKSDFYNGLNRFVELASDYSDAGITIAQFFIVYKNRVADYSSVLEFKQLIGLINVELEGLDDEETVILLSSKR